MDRSLYIVFQALDSQLLAGLAHGKRQVANVGKPRSDPENMENRPRNRDAGSLKRLDSIQDPGKRYMLKDRIGVGVYDDVYEGIDQQAGMQPKTKIAVRARFGKITRWNVITELKYALGNKKVAVKIQKITSQTQCRIVEEYRVLRELSDHPNLPDFYGIYRRRSARKSDYDEMWFVMEVSLDRSRLEVKTRMRHETRASSRKL